MIYPLHQPWQPMSYLYSSETLYKNVTVENLICVAIFISSPDEYCRLTLSTSTAPMMKKLPTVPAVIAKQIIIKYGIAT